MKKKKLIETAVDLADCLRQPWTTENPLESDFHDLYDTVKYLVVHLQTLEYHNTPSDFT